MLLGISTYSFPWAINSGDQNDEDNMTALQLVKFAAKNKIGFVQFGDNLPLHTLNKDELENVKSFADKKAIGLQVGTRRLTNDNLERYISIAKFLGSPFIRMVIDDSDYHPGTKEIIKVIKKTVPSLRKNNIVLAIENHDRFAATELKEIIFKTNPKFVGICLDTANSLGAAEGINEILQILSPYIVNLHIKDISIKRVDHKMGFVVEGVAAGDGMINIPAVIKQLNKTSRCKTGTLEVWSNPAATLKETIDKEKKLVQKSIHYLKNFLS